MLKFNTTNNATQAEAGTQSTAPEPETCGVLDYWTATGTAAFLDDRALAAVKTALAAITTCAGMVKMTLGTETAANGGIHRLKGRHAEAVNDVAARASIAAYAEERGRA